MQKGNEGAGAVQEGDKGTERVQEGDQGLSEGITDLPGCC